MREGGERGSLTYRIGLKGVSDLQDRIERGL